MILIYGNEPAEIVKLKQAIEQLTLSTVTQIAIHGLPFLKTVNRCQLNVKVTQGNSRVVQFDSSAFLWELTTEQCVEVIELLEPFELENMYARSKFQYLSQSPDISIIFSTKREW